MERRYYNADFIQQQQPENYIAHLKSQIDKSWEKVVGHEFDETRLSTASFVIRDVTGIKTQRIYNMLLHLQRREVLEFNIRQKGTQSYRYISKENILPAVILAPALQELRYLKLPLLNERITLVKEALGEDLVGDAIRPPLSNEEYEKKVEQERKRKRELKILLGKNPESDEPSKKSSKKPIRNIEDSEPTQKRFNGMEILKLSQWISEIDSGVQSDIPEETIIKILRIDIFNQKSLPPFKRKSDIGYVDRFKRGIITTLAYLEKNPTIRNIDELHALIVRKTNAKL